MKVKWHSIVGMTVVVLITTIFIRIPIPSKGYFNFGDVAVVFAGLLLGRKGGFIAGAVGSAIADIVGGFAIFAPVTFIAKGLEGLFAGLAKNKKGFPFHLFPLVGSFCMITIYFIGETVMPQITFAGAIAELIPNLIQAIGGYIGGKALYKLYTNIFEDNKGIINESRDRLQKRD